MPVDMFVNIEIYSFISDYDFPCVIAFAFRNAAGNIRLASGYKGLRCFVRDMADRCDDASRSLS